MEDRDRLSPSGQGTVREPMLGTPEIEERLDAERFERIIRSDVGPTRVLQLAPVPYSTGDTVWQVDAEGGASYRLRTRPAGGASFEAEAFRLRYLAEHSKLPVPRVLGVSGSGSPFPYLLTESLPGISWEKLRKFAPLHERAAVQREIGAGLGRLHRENQGGAFYVVEPGTMKRYPSWPQFFSSLWASRIKHILRTDRLEPRVLDGIEWIHGHLRRLLRTVETPRLIHGNLCGTRIIVDPADGGWRLRGFLNPMPAYAHRELDLALMEMRASPEPSFFEGYREELPIDEGYEFRKKIYMLYHVLDDVRLHGKTHEILTAMDLVKSIVGECGAWNGGSGASKC